MTHANGHKDHRGADQVSVRSGLAFLGRGLLQYPLVLALVALLSVGVALAEGLTIGLVLPFLDSIRGEEGTSTLVDTPAGLLIPVFDDMSTAWKIRTIALALLVIQVARSALIYGAQRLGIRLRLNLDRWFRLTVFDVLLGVSLGFIHRENRAHLFTVLNNFTGNSANVAMTMINATPYVTTLALYVALLLTLSWQLTLLAVSMAAVTMLLTSRLTGQLSLRGRRVNQSAVRLNHLGLESLSAMRIVRLFAREDYTRKQFSSGVDELQADQFASGTLQALVSPLYIASNVVILAVLMVIASFVFDLRDGHWVELTAIFMVVLFRLIGPTSSLNSARAVVASNMPSVQSLVEFLRREDKEELTEGRAEFSEFKDRIEYRNVSFKYGPRERNGLTDVTLEMRRGKTTAILGGSGGGKSTLLSLLARLYDPSKGVITIDGTDLRDFKSSSWRGHIGFVSQDTFLFDTTIRENIRYGQLDGTNEQIEQAAMLADAHDFIMDMTDGYDTVVGDRGVRLSGGQAQRVAIARAIISDPQLLILDEATSSLDTEAEHLVQAAIDRVSQQRTVVVVAHRLSTIRNADNIYVLEDGRVVEQGTHTTLMAKQGRYALYVRLQGADGMTEGR